MDLPQMIDFIDRQVHFLRFRHPGDPRPTVSATSTRSASAITTSRAYGPARSASAPQCGLSRRFYIMTTRHDRGAFVPGRLRLWRRPHGGRHVAHRLRLAEAARASPSRRSVCSTSSRQARQCASAPARRRHAGSARQYRIRSCGAADNPRTTPPDAEELFVLRHAVDTTGVLARKFPWPGGRAKGRTMNNYHFEEHHLLLRDQVRKMVERRNRADRFGDRRAIAFRRSWSRSSSATWVCCSSGCRRATADRAAISLRSAWSGEIAKVSESRPPCSPPNNSFPHPANPQFRQRGRSATISACRPKGRTITAVAITEPGTGSDVSSMKTQAVQDGEKLGAEWRQIYITFGSVAHFVAGVRAHQRRQEAPTASRPSSSTPRARDSRSAGRSQDGHRGVPNVPIFFDNDARAGREHGRPGVGPSRPAYASSISTGRLSERSHAAWHRRDRRTRRCRSPVQPATLIAGVPGIQFMLADMQMQTGRRAACSDCAAWPIARRTGQEPRW